MLLLVGVVVGVLAVFGVIWIGWEIYNAPLVDEDEHKVGPSRRERRRT